MRWMQREREREKREKWTHRCWLAESEGERRLLGAAAVTEGGPGVASHWELPPFSSDTRHGITTIPASGLTTPDALNSSSSDIRKTTTTETKTQTKKKKKNKTNKQKKKTRNKT